MFAEHAKVHHATKAKAEELATMLEAEYPALTIEPEYNEDESQVTGFRWLHRDAPDAEPTQIGSSRKAPELADLLAACEDQELDPEAIEAEEEEYRGGSVVDPMYRDQYREASSTKQSCGDFLAEWLVRVLTADGKLDEWAFAAILSNNGVDLSAKWAQVATGRSPGWQGRYRMNGRQALEKRICFTETLIDESGNAHEIDAEWLKDKQSKHSKWLAKERKRAEAEQAVADATIAA